MLPQDLASHTASQLDGEDSLYKQVPFRISELIEHGTLRPGECVPSVRKCSEQQNVSIATVTQAYRLLEANGTLKAAPRPAYYVRPRRWTRPPQPTMSNPAPSPV